MKKFHLKLILLISNITIIGYYNLFSQTQSSNYIHIYNIKEPGYYSANSITPTISATNAEQTIQYFDGIGRLIQTIQPSYTPDGNALITPKVYNEIGLDEMNYLPFASSNNNLDFIQTNDALTKLSNFYKGMFNEDPNGNAPILYENSPLNRILKQGSPGMDWGLTNAVNYSYLTNSLEEPALDAKYFTVSGNTCINQGSYSPNQLYITEIVDEDLSKIYEFKNKEGQLILKRSVIENEVFTDTYYVYDIYGLLRFIITPEGTSRISNQFSIGDEFANKYVYCYSYDNQFRLIEKQIPGKGSEYLIYDKMDRIIMYQDGNMRNRNNEWRFTKYDANGREIITGFTSKFLLKNRNEIQQIANEAEFCWEYLSHVTNFPIADNNHYTNRAFPEIDANCRIEEINYFDRYTVYMSGSVQSWVSLANLEYDPSDASFQIVNFNRTFVQGFPTVSFINNSPIANYYDYKGRIVQTREKNHLGGINIHSMKYYSSILNWIIATDVKHTVNNNASTYFEKYRYSFDNYGRQISRTYEIGDVPETQTVENEYDQLGQLIEKRYLSGRNVTQRVNYKYNIRGWITQINDPSTITPIDDLYGIELFYNKSNEALGNHSLYAGNISAIVYQNVNASNSPPQILTGIKAYVFTYDKISRLKDGLFKEKNAGVWNNTGKYNESITNYDLNGNILSLRRNGMKAPNNIQGIIDNLAYTYNGNQIIAIDDAVLTNNNGDFYDQGNFYNPNLPNEYQYDDNGNLIKDANTGIINIRYNTLNQPIFIEKTYGTALEYYYDATGKKLKQIEYHDNGKIFKTTDFIDNFVFINGKCAWNSFDEGRVVYSMIDNSSYVETHLKDHLGNIRIAYTYKDGSVIVKQSNNYYPFGMTIKELSLNDGSEATAFLLNENKYNNKLFQDELGLNWYDYGFRMYDPAIARWHCVDPMAELDYNFSPYNFCLNNPINLVDPDGLSTHTDSTGTVIAVYNDNNNTVYKHGELPENYATYEGETETYTDPVTGETKTREKTRLSGGENMGETENWDEFRAHNDETGKTLNKVEGKIMFGESWDYTIDLNNRTANKMDLSDVAANSLPNRIFDIKTSKTYAPNGPATGKMLNGKYATARSAGNYLAGLNGATGKFMGGYISLGTYMRLAGQVHSPLNFKGAPYYGEIPYAGRMIVSGFNAGVKKRK